MDSQQQIHPDLDNNGPSGGPPYNSGNYSNNHYSSHGPPGGPDDGPGQYLGGGPGGYQPHNQLQPPYHGGPHHQHPGPPPRQHSNSEPHGLPYNMSPHPYPPPPSGYTSPSIGHNNIGNGISLPPMSPDGSISPSSPMNYDNMPQSFAAGGGPGADRDLYHSRSGSSASSSSSGSPNASRAQSLVHRHTGPLRYGQQTPTTSPPSSTGRRSRGRASSDDEENTAGYMDAAQIRKDLTRRQRIEAEQKRRDDLRDWYQRLKEVLPLSNQKNSKTALLERATNLIANMGRDNTQMQERIAQLEDEVARLRQINERIALQSGGPGGPSSPQGSYDSMNTARPMTPQHPRGHEHEMRD